MKKFISVVALSAGMFFSGATLAATPQTESVDWTPNWQFSSVSLNKLDWSSNTTTTRGQHLKDFTFLEVEGGAGWNWGDVYGFLDVEDFANYRSEQDIKLSAKYSVNVYTSIPDVSLYHQVSVVESKDFDTLDAVVGLSYRTNVMGVKFAPFAGIQYSSHDADWQSNFSGMNGYMIGWSAAYDFTVRQEKFSVTNWHETTVGRTHEYLKASNEVKELAQNGAVALWWHPTRHLSTGVQYRYGDNKIGVHGNVNAVIYTIKYNF